MKNFLPIVFGSLLFGSLLLNISLINQKSDLKYELIMEIDRKNKTIEELSTELELSRIPSPIEQMDHQIAGTSTFSMKMFSTKSQVIRIDLRTRLVDSLQFFEKSGKRVFGEGPESDRVKNLIKKIWEIDGVIDVYVGPYKIMVTLAEAFSLEEVEVPILSVLKAEFPEESSKEIPTPIGSQP